MKKEKREKKWTEMKTMKMRKTRKTRKMRKKMKAATTSSTQKQQGLLESGPLSELQTVGPTPNILHCAFVSPHLRPCVSVRLRARVFV